jgi:hypothetical protein
MTQEPRSLTDTAFKEPPNDPTGVLTPLTITTFFIVCLHAYSVVFVTLLSAENLFMFFKP